MYVHHECYINSYLHLAAIFSHLTIIFLNKLMVYGVVQQVYGVVTPDSMHMVQNSLQMNEQYSQNRPV